MDQPVLQRTILKILARVAYESLANPQVLLNIYDMSGTIICTSKSWR